MSVEQQFVDILMPRRKEISNLLWVFKKVDLKMAFKHGHKSSPQSHKESVLNSPRISELVAKLSIQQQIAQKDLEQQILNILDEIGYEHSLKLIRWLGAVELKILLKVTSGLFVNESSILHVRNTMGNCPVIFVPSHRSYADFILMSYVLFHYDIAIPAIAAGMDFQGMLGMGEVLRHTGAFYMRRSYNNDSLYWSVFKQYINQLVTKGERPIEFFIEGTRSRSGKSLVPKFGFMNMILKAFFLSEVPDVLFVPINISYDRILEEKLFAFELLGVPKPKETTSGFFKSLTILREHFGKIYFNFSAPISAKQYYETRLDRSQHNLGPQYCQEITESEKALLPPLGYDIISAQQKHCVITTFNLIAIILNYKLVKQQAKVALNDLVKEVQSLKSVLETYGAYVDLKEIERDIEMSLVVHRNTIALDKDSNVVLVSDKIVLDKYNVNNLKGYALSAKTMTYCVPFIMLQLYINPVMHYLVESAIIVAILKTRGICSEEVLIEDYQFLKNLFASEFVSPSANDMMRFHNSLDTLRKLEVIKLTHGLYEVVDNKKLVDLLHVLIQPFLDSYFVVMAVLMQTSVLEEKMIFASVQKHLEPLINIRKNFVHPYCLSLDSLSNCLNSLVAMEIINKTKRESGMVYCHLNDLLKEALMRIEPYKSRGLVFPDVEVEHIIMKNKL